MEELKVFMPNQITLVKKLLGNVESEEQKHYPNKLVM
jgi:hypothetical protein